MQSTQVTCLECTMYTTIDVSICIRKIHAYGTYQRYELAIWVISKRWGQANKCELCKQLSGEDETCKALLPGAPGWNERELQAGSVGNSLG